MYNDCSMDLVKNQEAEILIDLSEAGKIKPWSEKASKTRVLADIYDEINPGKAERLRNCASFLDYYVCDNGKKRLVNANFCRVRLCPMCVWRRTLKIFSQTSAIMNVINNEFQYEYIFLTLTMKNCEPEDLSEAIDNMMLAWNKFSKYKAFKQAVKGFYRGFEVTHNLDVSSKDYDTFHPHFHAILAVKKSYFKSKDYLSQEKWTNLWAKALGIAYDPIVYVKKIKGNTVLAVAEVAKYAVKDGDYIIPKDEQMTLKTVKLLDVVLAKRRFVSFGGIFKDIHRRLNLDNPEDGDLVLYNNQPDLPDYKLVTYIWHSGYRQYIKS